jgi:S-DNA-T family DNA segregation ATPase FtsK/SpoIIIE
MRKMFPFMVDEDEEEEDDAPVPEADEDEDEDETYDESPQKAQESPAPKKEETALINASDAKRETKKNEYKNYQFPPIELLGLDADYDGGDIEAEHQANADKLIETLASFNITASIKGVDRGPRITRYEVVPSKGIKVSSVMNLENDIALALAADGIRMEAPIPGKSAIGIEIPNKTPVNVRLRELLETEDFKTNRSKTAVCIGKDVAGQPIINDISKMPHLLIAGATGMGKSVCINSLMISMLYKARPDEVKFIMIDPKQVEFTMYTGIPHLLVPVVSDAKKAAGALMWAVEEMERRFGQLNTLCVRNIDAYNEKIERDKSLGEPMSKIVIVIDEFADLMLQVKDPVENLVMRIAQKARAAGIHLIIGTQRPAVNVITGTIKANIPSRISCKVASNIDSRTVLDSSGAEKLLNKGDMLFAYSGAIKPLRVQGAFVTDDEVAAITDHLKKFATGNDYDTSVMEEIERAAQRCNKKGGGGDGDDDRADSSGEGYLNDKQFLDSVELAVNTGKISTSLIQRKISVGYGKAAKFIDIMEDMGIVGEANGQKPREVLITADEWREKLARTMLD